MTNSLPWPVQAEPERSAGAAPLASSTGRETRALWISIHRWTTRSDVDAFIDLMRAANINVALPLVYESGTPYFDHSRVHEVTGRFGSPDFDPAKDILPPPDELSIDILEEFINLRDAWRNPGHDPNWRNPEGGTDEYYFEVHPWFAVNMGGDYDTKSSSFPRPSKIQPWMLFADSRHPEFKKVYPNDQGVDHKYGCIDQPYYQHYLVNLIAGVAETYDVDGIHLDYIRSLGLCFADQPLDYPGEAFDYPGTLEAYRQWSGGRSLSEDTNWGIIKTVSRDGRFYLEDEARTAVSGWMQFNLDRLVHSIRDEIKASKPWVVISAAPAYKDPFYHCQEIHPKATECASLYGWDPIADGFSTQEDAEGASKSIVQGQHPWKWLAEGWVDTLIPFLYTTDTQIIVGMVHRVRTATREYMLARGMPGEDLPQHRIYPGIETYNVDQTPIIPLTAQQIGEQVEGLRSSLGIQGLALFDAKYPGLSTAHFPMDVAEGLAANATFAEAVPPQAVTQVFLDVPVDHLYHDEIEALYRAGYTAGCATDPLRYCPDQTMNRAESAVFVERGIHGTDGLPPQPTSQTFADLPLDSWAAKWAEALWQDHYTAGCGTDPLIYCPWQGHTRAEGCVFYLHMLNGATYEPPEPSQQTFADVPLEAWYAEWVQAAYDAGLITACQTTPDLRFCPNDPLSRALAAYMMAQAKELALP